MIFSIILTRKSKRTSTN